jgi:hypothetical protein
VLEISLRKITALRERMPGVGGLEKYLAYRKEA